MARPCSICRHPKRSEIDVALTGGTSIRDVAGQYRVSRTAVHRHLTGHLSARIQKARQADESQQLDEGKAHLRRLDALEQRLTNLLGEAEGVLVLAKASKDLKTVLQAVRESANTAQRLVALHELCARLDGALTPRGDSALQSLGTVTIVLPAPVPKGTCGYKLEPAADHFPVVEATGVEVTAGTEDRLRARGGDADREGSPVVPANSQGRAAFPRKGHKIP